jgi:E3 ubiquitin ligase
VADHAGEAYLIFAVLCGVLALAALIGCFSRLRRDRFIADTPLVRLRSAAQGYVRVGGIARSPPDETMRSPLTGRPCVWWDYQVEAREENAKGEAKYRTIEKATSVTPFVLDDSDAACLIGPVGAEVTATSNERWSGMSRHGGGAPSSHAILGLLGQDDYRFHERLIAPGTPLSVLGELRSHTEFGAVDQKAQEILLRWKHDQSSLLRRFDRNHDGQIGTDEWESARAAARAEAEATVLHSPIERVGVVGQTTHGEPFLIAPLDAEHLVRREKRRAFLLLLTSILCGGLCLWALARLSH